MLSEKSQSLKVTDCTRPHMEHSPNDQIRELEKRLVTGSLQGGDEDWRESGGPVVTEARVLTVWTPGSGWDAVRCSPGSLVGGNA